MKLRKKQDSTPIPPADAMPVDPTPTFRYRAVRAGIMQPLLTGLFRVRVQGRENLPAGAYVLVANHLNWLDSFVLLKATPAAPRVYFTGDPHALVKNRPMWWFVRTVGGLVPVDRKQEIDPQTGNVVPKTALYRHGDSLLQRGGVLGVYPEGQYGKHEGELVTPFRRGAGHWSINNNVPIVPVGLTGCLDLWFMKRITVNIGKPIDTTGMTVDAVNDVMEQQLRRLMVPYKESRGPKLWRRGLTRGPVS